MKIKLAKSEVIHFVGIGGIGMSGLALVMRRMGFRVQGSDINLNKNIERLKKNGIKVFIGHSKKNISYSTIIVVSSAVKKIILNIFSPKKKTYQFIKEGICLATLHH